jgi:hypothetical protein
VTCKICGGSGKVPMPRGMSEGFYLFMGAGCRSEDDGSKRMVCYGCDGTGKEKRPKAEEDEAKP